MGKAISAVETFIDNIPDEKLEGFSKKVGTIYSDKDFRLDMQGVSLLWVYGSWLIYRIRWLLKRRPSCRWQTKRRSRSRPKSNSKSRSKRCGRINLHLKCSNRKQLKSRSKRKLKNCRCTIFRSKSIIKQLLPPCGSMHRKQLPRLRSRRRILLPRRISGRAW